jgi:hypothetical protein
VFVWTTGTQASKKRGVADESGPIGGAGTEQQQETKKTERVRDQLLDLFFN